MRRNNRGPTEHHVERCLVTGKKKATYAQAKKEVKYLKYNKKYPGMLPVVYKCKHCGWWHVGNMTK